MQSIVSRFRSNAGGMALGSLIFQAASFLMLIVLKPILGHEHFAFFITQISIASIIGSVATLRFELLLFESKGEVDKEVLFSTLAISVVTLSVCAVFLKLILSVFDLSIDISPMSYVLAFGFGMIEAQSFLCVQMGRVIELVATRFIQTVILVLLAIIVWSGIGRSAVFFVYAIGVAAPILLWLAMAIINVPGRIALGVPSVTMLKRSIALTAAVMVNTVYANIPVVIASATQSAAFVADFGFVMRLLTGPITLIRQAYGHSYLADTFALVRNSVTPGRDIWRITRHAMLRSAMLYSFLLPFVIVAVVLLSRVLNISNPYMIIPLSLVTIGQVAINTVANVRLPLKKEAYFLAVDVVRTTILAVSLFFIRSVNYYIVFSVWSSILYFVYIALIRAKACDFWPGSRSLRVRLESQG
ncbi:hypothetical protein WBP07_17310 [Novosphingobium sp. BL-8A]|uniref:hypothetical protein n=1 Tax=Novosphingobium sp. BL-8A TaxID=3127639 RepID=UPI003757EEC2